VRVGDLVVHGCFWFSVWCVVLIAASSILPSKSRVGKRCQGGAFLSYAAVVRIGAVHCAGFLFMVNEKPETSGFSLVFIRPAGGSPAGEIFC
jgi:hypothetical protein